MGQQLSALAPTPPYGSRYFPPAVGSHGGGGGGGGVGGVGCVVGGGGGGGGLFPNWARAPRVWVGQEETTAARADVLPLEIEAVLEAFAPAGAAPAGLTAHVHREHVFDPAFEASDEWDVLERELLAGWRKWPTGIFMAWYPLKNPRQSDLLAEGLIEAGIGSAIRLELMIDDPLTATKLAGCGLMIINPPWTMRAAFDALMPPLAARLARSARAGYRCEVIAG
jgi:hypothetical protein